MKLKINNCGAPIRYNFNRMLIFALLLFVSSCCPSPIIMPDKAFSADISITNSPPVMETGERRRIDVKITNTSQTEWQTHGSESSWLTRGENDGGKYRVKLGNHWLDTDGKVIINDDGRAPLPDVVKPGETVKVSLGITAPPTAGEYILELDLVQENVSWFALKGSTPFRCKITVE